MDAAPDRALVASLRRADPVAFGRVHALYGPRLYNFLARLTGRTAIAEDLYQELWLKLAVHAPRLEADTDLGAWLYTVARNLAYSERRRERLRFGPGAKERAREHTGERARERGEERTHEAAAGGASPYDWATANETEALVDRALADIPEAFREILLLVIVAGLEPEQAGVVLQLKPEALRQRLSRARAKLAERLDELTRAPRARMEPEAWKRKRTARTTRVTRASMRFSGGSRRASSTPTSMRERSEGRAQCWPTSRRAVCGTRSSGFGSERSRRSS